MNKMGAQDHSASKEQSQDLNFVSFSSELTFFSLTLTGRGEGCVCLGGGQGMNIDMPI